MRVNNRTRLMWIRERWHWLAVLAPSSANAAVSFWANGAASSSTSGSTRRTSHPSAKSIRSLTTTGSRRPEIGFTTSRLSRVKPVSQNVCGKAVKVGYFIQSILFRAQREIIIYWHRLSRHLLECNRPSLSCAIELIELVILGYLIVWYWKEFFRLIRVDSLFDHL